VQVIPRRDALHVDKPDGTSVDYFLFPEYEIHLNEVAPGTIQQWHHHDAIEETLVITDGALVAHWRDDQGTGHEQTVSAGDVVRVARSAHTFENRSEDTVKFVVVRLVLDGTDKSALIKSDKVLD
jgi:uncharacterized cupin superfamily protein